MGYWLTRITDDFYGNKGIEYLGSIYRLWSPLSSPLPQNEERVSIYQGSIIVVQDEKGVFHKTLGCFLLDNIHDFLNVFESDTNGALYFIDFPFEHYDFGKSIEFIEKKLAPFSSSDYIAPIGYYNGFLHCYSNEFESISSLVCNYLSFWFAPSILLSELSLQSEKVKVIGDFIEYNSGKCIFKFKIVNKPLFLKYILK